MWLSVWVKMTTCEHLHSHDPHCNFMIPDFGKRLYRKLLFGEICTSDKEILAMLPFEFLENVLEILSY